MPDLPVMLITGTGKGIGRGLAEYFAGAGYQVVGCSRSAATSSMERVEHAQVDVGSEPEVTAWVRSVRRRYGRIDVAVCNAGLAPATQLLTMTSGAVLEGVLRTNVGGTFYVCREVARAMMQRRFGRIITLSSMAVGLHQEGTSAYAASKSAVVEMTKIMAKELAPAGITCNVVAPSMFMTDAVAALGERVIADALQKLTIKREVTLEELCNVVEFFAAPASGCITGQVLHMGLVS
jgi:3-oxoacyl-[acyl-carrier protein] reductase